MKKYILYIILAIINFLATYAVIYLMAIATHSIINLYTIPYLNHLSVGNIFGAWLAYTLFTIKKSDFKSNISNGNSLKYESDSDMEDVLFSDLKINIAYFLVICFGWLTAFVFHYFFI